MRPYTPSSGARAARRLRAPLARPNLEALEDRLLLSISPIALPGVEVLSSSALGDAPKVTASGSPSQSGGFSPQQIKQAYSFDQISFNNGAVQGDGSGQTIAIVDAYNQPNIGGDLQAFDSAYGLPAPPNFVVLNQSGGTTLPANNTSWGVEESLDVEWAHAIAPGANILLVEASSDNYSDLVAAANYARTQPGVSVVSISWGSTEFAGETAYDSDFTTPSGHEGVTFVAAAGDNGTVEYPAASPNVLTVGGTQLSLNTSGNYGSETAWSSGGGGISTYETQPSYQHGVVTQTSARRAVPDVAYNASTASGYSIYDSYGYDGWTQGYGTSAAAPQWAALIAIADQGRALQGKGSLDGGSQTLPALYQLPKGDFHDVTSGGNGSYSAGPGYDLVTGRGSPIANLVVAGLVAQGSSENPPWVASPANASSSTVTGTATNLSVRGGDAYNASALTYTWSVLSAPSGATEPTFSVNANHAAQNTAVAFRDAGSYVFQVTITNVYGLTATSDVQVTVTQTLSGISLSPPSASLYNNASLQFTATALDQFGHAMAAHPSWTWKLSGDGTINSSGQYTAPSNGSGSITVSVSGDGLMQAATVTYGPALPPTPSGQGQLLSFWLQLLEGWLNQLSQLESLWKVWLSKLKHD